METARVYLGIGSNVGDREARCREALEYLGREGIRVTRVSPMYETKPWGVEDQRCFINMAVEAETTLSPDALLSAVKKIETMMGRRQTVRYGPRVIDLDILFFDDRVVEKEDLQIPHPLLHERCFVLTPLLDVAPDMLHPVLKKTVKCLYEEWCHDKDGSHQKQRAD